MDQRLEDIKQKFQRFEKAETFSVDHGDPPRLSQYIDPSDVRYLIELATSLTTDTTGRVQLILKTSQLHTQVGFLVGVFQALMLQRHSDIQSALDRAKGALLKEGYINEGDVGDRPGLNGWGCDTEPGPDNN